MKFIVSSDYPSYFGFLELVDPNIPTSIIKLIIDNEIDCLPVVRCIEEGSRSYEVVGRITKTNFTRLLVDLAEGKGGNYHS